MRELGYRGVTEVPICRFGRVFLTVATGAVATALTPSLSYTVRLYTSESVVDPRSVVVARFHCMVFNPRN